MKHKPKKIKEPIFCLFHKHFDCVCIKPITNAEDLAERIKRDERLKAVQKEYGIK